MFEVIWEGQRCLEWIDQALSMIKVGLEELWEACCDKRYCIGWFKIFLREGYWKWPFKQFWILGQGLIKLGREG